MLASIINIMTDDRASTLWQLAHASSVAGVILMRCENTHSMDHAVVTGGISSEMGIAIGAGVVSQMPTRITCNMHNDTRCPCLAKRHHVTTNTASAPESAQTRHHPFQCAPGMWMADRH